MFFFLVSKFVILLCGPWKEDSCVLYKIQLSYMHVCMYVHECVRVHVCILNGTSPCKLLTHNRYMLIHYVGICKVTSRLRVTDVELTFLLKYRIFSEI